MTKLSNIDLANSYAMFLKRKAKAESRKKPYHRSGSNLMVTFKAALGQLRTSGRKWADLREVQQLMENR